MNVYQIEVLIEGRESKWLTFVPSGGEYVLGLGGYSVRGSFSKECLTHHKIKNILAGKSTIIHEIPKETLYTKKGRTRKMFDISLLDKRW